MHRLDVLLSPESVLERLAKPESSPSRAPFVLTDLPFASTPLAPGKKEDEGHASSASPHLGFLFGIYATQSFFSDRSCRRGCHGRLGLSCSLNK